MKTNRKAEGKTCGKGLQVRLKPGPTALSRTACSSNSAKPVQPNYFFTISKVHFSKAFKIVNAASKYKTRISHSTVWDGLGRLCISARFSDLQDWLGPFASLSIPTVLHDQGDLWGSIWHYDALVWISFPDRLQCWTSCHSQQCGYDGSDNWSAQRWMAWTDEARPVNGSIV